MEICDADQRRAALLRYHDLCYLFQTRSRLLGRNRQSAVRLLVYVDPNTLRFVLPMGPSMAPTTIRELRGAQIWYSHSTRHRFF